MVDAYRLAFSVRALHVDWIFLVVLCMPICDTNGRVVRDLDLGHQRAGIYRSRKRAAHWDGKNEFGEPVPSGVYFYTLKAGHFTATRKMLIRK